MNRILFAFSLAWLLAFVTPGYSQEGGAPIKITSMLHNDGSRTDTQKDIDNRVSETKTYDASKKLIQHGVYALDENGNETEGVIYNAKDVIIARVSFKYDAQGHLSEQINKTPNGVVIQRLVYTRDALGHLSVGSFDAQGNLLNSDGGIATPTPKKSGRSR